MFEVRSYPQTKKPRQDPVYSGEIKHTFIAVAGLVSPQPEQVQMELDRLRFAGEDPESGVADQQSAAFHQLLIDDAEPAQPVRLDESLGFQEKGRVTNPAQNIKMENRVNPKRLDR